MNVDFPLMNIRLLGQLFHHLLDIRKLFLCLFKERGIDFLAGTNIYRPVRKDLVHRTEIVSIRQVKIVVKKLVGKVTKKGVNGAFHRLELSEEVVESRLAPPFDATGHTCCVEQKIWFHHDQLRTQHITLQR